MIVVGSSANAIYMELFRHCEPDLPACSVYASSGEDLALASRTLAQIMSVSGQVLTSISCSEQIQQLYLTAEELYALTSVLRQYHRPHCVNPITWPHSEGANYFAVSETCVVFLRGDRVVVVAKADPASALEITALFTPRLVLPSEASVLLLQCDFEVSLMRFSGLEVRRIPLTSKVIRLFMDRLPDSSSLPHLKGFLVTKDQESRVVGYDGNDVENAKAVVWRDRPTEVAFLYPGFVVGLMREGEAHIAGLVTGTHLITLSSLKAPFKLCVDRNYVLLYDQRKWVQLQGPAPEKVMSYFLRRGEYDTALAMNDHISGGFASKIYLELGLHSFFRVRDYSQASYYFHKSGRYWIPCLFFKHSVKLEKNVKTYCEPFFQDARAELHLTNVPESISALISEGRKVFEDDELMGRAQQAFYQYFQSLREERNEAQRFAEVWLFHTCLKFSELTDKLVELLVTDNLLPSKHCEKVLRQREKYELLYKLYLSKKVYQPALELMRSHFLRSRERRWLADMRSFLCKMQKDEGTFETYLAFLFEADRDQASSLLTVDRPALLKKLNLSRKLLPLLRSIGANRLAIDLLSNAAEATQAQHNELAELLILEVTAGRLPARSLTDYLAKEPFHYEPREVLKLLPASFPNERCILLDKLHRYDEILHYYLYGHNPRKALEYVREKESPVVTNALLYHLTRPEHNDQKTLLELLGSSPRLFDNEYALEMLPRELGLGEVKRYLTEVFEGVERDSFVATVQRRTAEQKLMQLWTDFSEEASTQCVDLTEDSRCAECGELLTGEFLLTETRKVVHADCHVPELLV